MQPKLRLPSWFLFAATMYLILQEALWPWLKLPGLGNIGFTVVFVLFAVTHCAAFLGARFAALFFLVSAALSYLMEETGVRTGLIYGRYHYSDLLGAKLGHVPVIIPLAWFMMIYPSWMVAKELISGVDTRPLTGITALAGVGALVMTAWDVVMDPGMAAGGNWIWETGGVYFGVPRHNYLGWLLTTFLVYWIAGWLTRGSEPAGKTKFAALPILVYALFALRYVASNRLPALQVVALFSMGTPSILAMIRIFLTAEKTTNGEITNTQQFANAGSRQTSRSHFATSAQGPLELH
jgi:putative membrane protein